MPLRHYRESDCDADMTRGGWNRWSRTVLVLYCLLLFAASVVPRSDAEAVEDVVIGEANVETLSDDDDDASHALVYDASSFRSEIERRHFVMLFKSRFVIKASTFIVISAGFSYGPSFEYQTESICLVVFNLLAVRFLAG